MAAAYTTAISYFILLILQGYLEKKVAGRRVISLKKSGAVSVMYFTLNLVTMMLFNLPWYVRYGVIAAVTLVAVRWMLPQFLRVLKDFKKK